MQGDKPMTWEQLWLDYNTIEDYKYLNYFKNIYTSYWDNVIESATVEIKNAITHMLSFEPAIHKGHEVDGFVHKQGVHLLCNTMDSNDESNELGDEGFKVIQKDEGIYIYANKSVGILYGVFELIRYIKCKQELQGIHVTKRPSNPYRMLNHWDNMDGSIERGYSGNSFFFINNRIQTGARIKDYARLVSSVGINGVVINNVNVNTKATYLITEEYLKDVKKVADIFGNYGIKLFLSLNFAAPMELSNIDSADPLKEEVITWWKERMKLVYEYVPNLGGFLVKADSEGRPGPFTYQRTQADGANMLASAILPYNGLIIWRCFVYNCKQDWRDRKTDRARASYDHFMPLDGKFMNNVILQIKNGPMDFQVREPVSPLFGGLKATNMMLEVQIAQEYTGQQRHVCYLIPMFKEILAFQTYAKENATIANIVNGSCYGQKNCGMVAVANTGDDVNWTGHDFAAVNLYGLGRLSFDSSLSSEDIAREWITMTYGFDLTLNNNIFKILINSWKTYEKYTSPLGIGWMVNRENHYGPNVDGYEYDRWGTYHRADWEGIGVDRSDKGTAFTMQFNEPNASMYNDIETCPEELLLFFHYIPYTYRLKSGKTLIQHIYDTHFEGVSEVEDMLRLWEECKGKVPDIIFERILNRLKHQYEHSMEWRDVINTYFYRKSGIPDEKGRTIY